MSLGLVSHFWNEELLLPSWVKHHLPLVDQAILINQGSTDRSVEIIKELAPHWRIVDSCLSQFCCIETDIEVMQTEDRLQTDFKLTLNTTEFIWTPNFKERLERAGRDFPEAQAFAMRSFCLVDNVEQELEEPIYKNRTNGLLDRFFGVNVPRHHRFVHRSSNGAYSVGRHSTSLPSQFLEDVFLLHMTFSPWPQCFPRKMAIQTKMTQADIMHQRGVQHIQNPETMLITYNNWLRESGDLTLDKSFMEGYHFYINQFEGKD